VENVTKFYIYCFQDGAEILYVGKGTGRRLAQQEKRFGFAGSIIERLSDEEEAYKREIYWIGRLLPTQNKNAGGGGGMSYINPIPHALRGKITTKEWDKARREAQRDQEVIESTGTRRYAARLLLTKLDENNCELFGVSKVALNRLFEVANGPKA
jgi:hypothetical protein